MSLAKRIRRIPTILPLFACLTAAGGLGPAGAQTTGAVPLPAGKAAEPQPVLACAGLGPGFINIPGTQTCLRMGADVFVEERGDFVTKDLDIETRRLTGPPAPNTPIALYQAADVTGTTDRYQPQTNGRITLTTVTPVDGKPVVSYLSIRSGYDDNVADQGAQKTANTGVGLDQAWINAYGVTAGLRSSVFDFSSGYTNRGHASQRILNQLSYEKKLGDKASIALALEDGTARRYEEGVWALYGPRRYPDIVLRGRLDPEWGSLHLPAPPIRSATRSPTAAPWAGRSMAAWKSGRIGERCSPPRRGPAAVSRNGRLCGRRPRLSRHPALQQRLCRRRGWQHRPVQGDVRLGLLRASLDVDLQDHGHASALPHAGLPQGFRLAGRRRRRPGRRGVQSRTGHLFRRRASYFFDRAQGNYLGAPGAEVPVNYLQALLYLRRSL